MKTLLLSSGGIKGFAFIGIWKYLEKQNLIKDIQTYSGVSIGAFFSLWFLLGYTFDEIYQILADLDLLNLFSFDFANFFESYGMIDVEQLEKFIIDKIEYKGFHRNVTFKQLFDQTGKDLHTYSFCVDTQTLETFNKENTPDCPVRIAVLMSISIPIIFKPVMYDGKHYVDGAIKNGFPIEHYELKDTIPCVVIKEPIEKIHTIMDYVFNIVTTLLPSKPTHQKLCVVTSKIGSLHMELNKEHIDLLIQSGFDAIIDFFNPSL